MLAMHLVHNVWAKRGVLYQDTRVRRIEALHENDDVRIDLPEEEGHENGHEEYLHVRANLAENGALNEIETFRMLMAN